MLRKTQTHFPFSRGEKRRGRLNRQTVSAVPIICYNSVQSNFPSSFSRRHRAPPKKKSVGVGVTVSRVPSPLPTPFSLRRMRVSSVRRRGGRRCSPLSSFHALCLCHSKKIPPSFFSAFSFSSSSWQMNSPGGEKYKKEREKEREGDSINQGGFLKMKQDSEDCLIISCASFTTQTFDCSSILLAFSVFPEFLSLKNEITFLSRGRLWRRGLLPLLFPSSSLLRRRLPNGLLPLVPPPWPPLLSLAAALFPPGSRAARARSTEKGSLSPASAGVMSFSLPPVEVVRGGDPFSRRIAIGVGCRGGGGGHRSSTVCR